MTHATPAWSPPDELDEYRLAAQHDAARDRDLGMPVARGGSWYTGELGARNVNRGCGGPTEHHSSIGVRLCACRDDRLCNRLHDCASQR